MTPLKAIRAKCLKCCGASYKEVKLCQMSDCPLYPYRFGKNPNLKGKRKPNNGIEALQKYRARLSA